ncbi:hypothetical protein AB0C38_43240 [Amycolatopsis sp. NPDC048633]|uniref:hypothetical protein n=1 Tax=Amycolatopsis sp. NPDC048633 TaxID=3157095 RepID=UPI0033E22665
MTQPEDDEPDEAEPEASVPEEDEPDGVENSISVGGNMTGNVVQVGQIHGNFYRGSGAPARSWYLETVKEIAPFSLENRTAELAELAGFCAASDPAPQYAWWRAEAWTGKTALMASFVLDPPRNVRLVSFFITARYAGSDTRDDFLNAVIPQLAALLEIEAPKGDGPSDFRGLLSAAAKFCNERGERLVLLIDGLDEDRGAGQEGGARSIAALLPRNPSYGLRIVVTGRPNPGIPYVLPDDHPLRDPAIVRGLDPSPAAAAVRHVMEADLDRLLDGATAEAKDVLGLLVAARGGLSRQDLVELTGEESRVKTIMDSVQGRAFSRRHARWDSRTSPEIYLLSHEGLQAEAAHRLGKTAIRAYRQRIMDWATGYWKQGWPGATPQFLLQGYPRLLQEAGCLASMIDCVTDLARQARLVEVSGGEAAAQVEVATAHAALLASTQPDVLRLVKLTMHRDDLRDRNARTPAKLPALWARLGELGRAEAMARSISEPFRRLEAVSELVDVLVGDGQIDRVDRLIAETVDEVENPQVRRRFVRVVAATGDLTRARAIAEAITDADQRKHALITVSAVEPGVEPGALLAAAEEIEARNVRSDARHFVARWLVEHDEIDWGIQISEEFSSIYSFDIVERAVEVLAEAGDFVSARRLLESIEGDGARRLLLQLDIDDLAHRDLQFAREEIDGIEDNFRRESLMRKLVRVAVEVENIDLAESLVNSMASYEGKVALFDLLQNMSAGGFRERAVKLLNAAVLKPERRFDLSMHADGLTVLAEGALSAKDYGAARALAREAESAARHVGNSYQSSVLFARFVEFAVSMKDVRRAERLGRVIIEADMKRQDVVEIAQLLGEYGDLGLAESLAFRVDKISVLMRALMPLLRRLRGCGETGRMQRIVSRVDELVDRVDVAPFDIFQMNGVADFYCTAGLPRRALQRIAEFDSENQFNRSASLAHVVREFCLTGEIESAIEVVRAEGDGSTVDWRLVEAVAGAMGKVGYGDGIEVLKRLGIERFSESWRLFLAQFAEHDAERALEIAQNSLEDYARTPALLAIASRVDEPIRSRVLAEVMQGTDWSRVLSTLSADEQSGLAEVVDQFVTLQEARLGLHSEDG